MAKPPPQPKSTAQLLSEDPELIDCLFLVSKGVPFDVAFSLDDDERLAWVVVMGQFQGLRFNWTTGRWETPTK